MKEDCEEPYFTEEAWSAGKKVLFISGCALMAWVGIGLLISGAAWGLAHIY